MRTYVAATGNHAQRLRQTGQDHIEECVGIGAGSRRTYCTLEYLRDRIREVFDNRANAQPLVTIQTKQPNLITEGLKVTGWMSSEELEMVQCDFEGQCQQFDLSNIVMFQVCN